MAEDAINRAIKIAGLTDQKCVTENLKIDDTRQTEIEKLIAENLFYGEILSDDLPYRTAEIVYAIRFEMARTVEDVLARRTRILFLNAALAVALAPNIAEILARELGKDEDWKQNQIAAFNETARHYSVEKTGGN